MAATQASSCAANTNRLGSGVIKQWFIGIITPNFKTPEARARCGSTVDIDPNFIPVPRLNDTMRLMRQTANELNPRPSVPGYVALEKPDRSFCSRWFSPLEPGSVRSCSAALAATALGAGALALPYAFSLTGVGLGLLTMTAAALVSALSLQILMVAARYTGTASYAAALELAVGSPIASAALDFTILLNGVGAVTCILIFEGDFLPSVFASPPGLAGIDMGRSSAVLGAALAVWPLTLPAEISALRYVAVAVPVALIVTIAIVCFDAREFHAAARARGDGIVWWNFDARRWLQAAAIMVNAFANHTNAVPAANQLDTPSIARIVKATVNANLLVWILLVCLGIGGYASWAGATKGDFLLNYPKDRPEIWVCRLMLALIVYFVLPVALLPTAKSCAQLILSAGGFGRQVGRKTHAASATLLLALCTGIALRVADVASVVGLLGGLLASSLMFWFPALVFRYLVWPTQPRVFRLPVLLVIVFFGACCWASVALTFIP
eukprot:CAMPEP_0179031558 /NCGR_PEP_ID=MMETSP0796-20121207/11132_1 /TAXON_ID=73915 /ORGANISM="Pyrodinium bahamense, Strain pbaha01" /LENGTH=495 /DNA_ID=CAMNT_0020727753 /DNA_START=17 /DNA_END=1504 /DNA_ORIENTATION=-